jgi:uncharacterized protein involved in exopolysaccharide biosynthesis
MQTQQDPGISEVIGFIRRRWLAMALVAIVLAAVGLPIVFTLPPLYRSTATILIEEQEIPNELVRSTITSYADERMQVIGQRVMTRATLLPIIEKFELYNKERRYASTEEVLEKMRKDIRVEPVSANITDRRSGNRGAATIAFRLSFDSPEPAKAQRVANELVTLYLNENLRSRQQRVGETQTFLSDEAARVGREISELEGKLAKFKRENAGRLPELLSMNMQLRDRAESELDEIDRRMRTLEERKIYLESQVVVMRDATPPGATAGDRTLDPNERLRVARNQLTSLEGVYADSHPDVVRLRREVAALEKNTGATPVEADVKRLEEARAELKRLSERYAADHPDVNRQKRIVASLEDAAAKPVPKPKAEQQATNPGVISLQVQIQSANQEMKDLRGRRAEVVSRMGQYNVAIRETPGVEQLYRDLVRDHENASKKYQDLRAKQMEAEVAVELEKDRKGERFSLIEPPQYPDKPTEPNRKKLLAMAMIGSLGGGVGAGVLAESLNRSVTSPRSLASLLEAPVIGIVPRVVDEAARARRKRWLIFGLIAAVLTVLAGLVAVHFLYMPLDTLWHVLLRRLQLS